MRSAVSIIEPRHIPGRAFPHAHRRRMVIRPTGCARWIALMQVQAAQPDHRCTFDRDQLRRSAIDEPLDALTPDATGTW